MGSAADNYGRRAVLGLTLFGLVLSGVVTSLVETLVEFAVLQLLMSASITAFQAISTVLLFEVTPQVHRMLFCVLNICVPLVLGTVVLGLIGTTSMHWSAMQLVVLSPTLLLLLTYHQTDESPLWLITSWKFKDAERVILWAARKNGLPDLDKAYHFQHRLLFPVAFRNAHRFRWLCAIFNCYYTIARYKSFGGGAVFFYIMIGIANMFTQTVNYFVLRGCGRRKPILAYFLGLSVLMTSLTALVALEMELAFAKVAVPEHSWWKWLSQPCFLVLSLPETLAMSETDKGQEAAQEDKWRLDSLLKQKKKSRKVPRKCIAQKLDR
ncbi:solute carrier family 22 member 9-like [Ixodes scapularis]|uniref:solute carrier family 22 member 9-like n=1 Tax=Ixodes scapularis TaxID=6945 RepID=UPI001A9CD283|nr:solute carrier family 22 member 9-like [Ixodes scapularis]